MAAQNSNNNADKVFVVLPETYDDGLSLLSWVLEMKSGLNCLIVSEMVI